MGLTDYTLGDKKLWQAGRDFERERIIKIITKRMQYDCRCKCECHAEPPPCIACQADGELIEIIRGD